MVTTTPLPAERSPSAARRQVRPLQNVVMRRFVNRTSSCHTTDTCHHPRAACSDLEVREARRSPTDSQARTGAGLARQRNPDQREMKGELFLGRLTLGDDSAG